MIFRPVNTVPDLPGIVVHEGKEAGKKGVSLLPQRGEERGESLRRRF